MRGKKTDELVYELVQPLTQRRGWELVDIEFVKEGGNWHLRIYIDKDGGVDLTDCEELSQEISEVLDKKDPIAHPYFLEVSSPGIERPLKTEHDFQRFHGRRVVVHTYQQIEGQKQINGELGIVDEKNLELRCDKGKVIYIPREKIAQVRLAWEK